MRRAYFHLALALLMLVTGSINILSVKYTDKLKSENTAGKLVPFNHPFFQACGMFLGKLLSMVAFPAFYAIKWFRKKHSEQSAAISSGIEDSWKIASKDWRTITQFPSEIGWRKYN